MSDRIIDTALPFPESFSPLAQAPSIPDHIYELAARSCVVLMVKPINSTQLRNF